MKFVKLQKSSPTKIGHFQLDIQIFLYSLFIWTQSFHGQVKISLFQDLTANLKCQNTESYLVQPHDDVALSVETLTLITECCMESL